MGKEAILRGVGRGRDRTGHLPQDGAGVARTGPRAGGGRRPHAENNSAASPGRPASARTGRPSPGAARFRRRTRAAPKIAMTEPTVLPEQAPRLAVATEARFTERFALRYRDRLRYNHRRGLWLIYAPPLWRPDSDGEVYRLALEHVRREQVAALQIDDPDLRKKHMAFALRADSKIGLDRLVGLARNLKPLADAGTGWDADPWLIGTPNGILESAE